MLSKRGLVPFGEGSILYDSIMIFDQAKKEHFSDDPLDQSLEYFLGISVFFMILVHANSIFFSTKTGYLQFSGSDTILYITRLFGFFNISIPATAAYSLATRMNTAGAKVSYWDQLRNSFKVLILLFFVEFVFDMAIYLPNFYLKEYSFGVLQFTGLSVFLLSLCSRVPKWTLAILIPLLLYLETFCLPMLSDLGLYVLSGTNSYRFQWALVPWFSVSILGFLLGHVWSQWRYKKWGNLGVDAWVFIGSLLGIAALILCYGLSFQMEYNLRWGDSIYHPGTHIVVIHLLFILLMLATGSLISKRKMIKRDSILDLSNRQILGIYIFHLVLCRFFVLPLFRTSEVKELILSQGLSSGQVMWSFVSAVVFTYVSTYVTFWLLQKYAFDRVYLLVRKVPHG